ncbi:hypothetical protein HU719_014905 [Pseudomonas sp. SWRI107]|uniref:hypothetical protein n=1 Tax=Pseudomonas farsensis TaxID=2745492 RepID=UPI0016446E2C|nr:hypothetical protein [Pseudomonas farsensis]MBV4532696.1 hypothetical protein [Pseudomonas farsensis]
MRIRGQIGDWPVDLTIELDPAQWAQLARGLQAHAPAAAQTPAPAAAQPAARVDDGHWAAACELLRQAGRINGPELLERLETLTGSTASGKRLLVRLRHCAQVRVQSGTDAPVYCWLG